MNVILDEPSLEIEVRAINYPEGSTVVIMRGDRTVIGIDTSESNTASAKFTVTQVGKYIFYAYALKENGEKVPDSDHEGIVVVDAPSSEPASPPSVDGASGGGGGSGGGSGGGGSGGSGSPTTVRPGTLQQPAPSSGGSAPASEAAAASTPASAPSSAALNPTAPALSIPFSGPAAQAGPPAVGDVVPLPWTPDAADLWSGVHTLREPSLLDGAETPAEHGGVPMGAVLLGVGALAMTGVGAVAGERRLALARRSRS